MFEMGQTSESYRQRKIHSDSQASANETEPSYKSLLKRILEAVSVANCDVSRFGEDTKLSEPQIIPVSSFLSRWSAIGSYTEDESIQEDNDKPAPSDSKWRTSSIRSTGLSVHSDRPSVYEESLEMIAAAVLIYTYADLRKMAREGKIQGSGLMKHPITIHKVINAIRTHRKALENEVKYDYGDLEARLKALHNVQESQLSSFPSSPMIERLLRGSSKKKETVLTHFHDEQSTQGMCYGIAVNHMRKRITVIFRGSVTKPDFFTDVQLALETVGNPVAKLSVEATATIKLHTGFYQYLFKIDETGRRRLERILDDVKGMMRQNRGYRFYCTGHSLGGALASLCGFYAACDPELTKNGPVVVVSVASPRVGNDCFRTAFQNLERLQQIQHLHLSNKEDVVTLLPFVALKKAGLTSSVLSATSNDVNLYKHCGIHLKFESGNMAGEKDEDECFTVTYAKDKVDDESAMSEELKRSVTAAKLLLGSLVATKADFKKVTNCIAAMSTKDGWKRAKDFSTKVTLDQLYADKRLVGSTVASPIVDPVIGPDIDFGGGSEWSLFGAKRKSARSLMV